MVKFFCPDDFEEHWNEISNWRERVADAANAKLEREAVTFYMTKLKTSTSFLWNGSEIQAQNSHKALLIGIEEIEKHKHEWVCSCGATHD